MDVTPPAPNKLIEPVGPLVMLVLPERWPIVCAPELLAGAEARATAFPHLAYDWCIRYAAVPLERPRRPRLPRRSELAAARAEKRRAHRRTMQRGLTTGWDQ